MIMRGLLLKCRWAGLFDDRANTSRRGERHGSHCGRACHCRPQGKSHHTPAFHIGVRLLIARQRLRVHLLEMGNHFLNIFTTPYFMQKQTPVTHRLTQPADFEGIVEYVSHEMMRKMVVRTACHAVNVRTGAVDKARVIKIVLQLSSCHY